MQTSRFGFLATVAPFLLIATALVFSFRSFVADDAFIVGRYALNAADGLGLVYNEGHRVSALTSPLHALVETVFALLGLDPVATYRVTAPFALAAGLAAAARIAGLSGWRLAVFSAVSLTSPFLALWSVGGLETPLLAILLALFFATVLRIMDRGDAKNGELLALGALAGLIFMTRYDAMLVLIAPMATLAVLHRNRAALWAGAVLAAAIAGAWCGFALIYYGDLLPTSAYVKLGGFTEPREVNILVILNALLLTGGFLTVPIARRALPRTAQPKAIAIALWVSFVLWAFYATYAAGQHMMFGYRFFAPYLPLLGLWLARAPSGSLIRVVAIVVVFNLAVGLWMQNAINPRIIHDLPIGGQVSMEVDGVSPSDYATFIETLREDADDLKRHWEENGDGSTPRIFLYTGGTGYWLRDFHVFETLIDYRQFCSLDQDRQKFDASHYVQFLDERNIVEVNAMIHDYVQQRADVDETMLSRSDIMYGRVTKIGYRFGANPISFTLPERTDIPCRDSNG